MYARRNKVFLCINLIAIMAIALSPLSALAAKPTITAVSVTTKSVAVTFSENVVNSTSSSATDFSKSVYRIPSQTATSSNWALQSPSGTNVPISNITNWVEYTTSSKKAILYGLNLTAGNTYALSMSGISDVATATAMDSFASSGTVSAVSGTIDPYINQVIPNYGKANDTVVIQGTNFGASTGDVDFQPLGGGSNFGTVTSWADTSIVVQVPSAMNGYKDLKIKRASDNTLSNKRNFALYTSTSGIITGSVSSTNASDVEDVRVIAYIEGFPSSDSTLTQKNGSYSILVSTGGTYSVRFETPPGATKGAPDKLTNKSVNLNSVTNVGVAQMLSVNAQGTVYAPDGTTVVSNASVMLHNREWTIQKYAITDANGAYSLAVSAGTYSIYATPPGYNPNNYRNSLETEVTVPSSGSVTKNISLTAEKVTGTIKTPSGSVSDSNPFPDVVVPNASVSIHTSNWSSSYWGQTDSSGNFSFGSIADGTYLMDIDPPYSGDYKVYPRTSIGEITISGTTALGIKRFATPNIFGRALQGTSPVENSWVSLHKEGFWAGASTNAAGRFAFGGVSAGKYKLEISPPGGTVNMARIETDIEISATEATNGKNLGDFVFAAPNVTGKILPPTGSSGVRDVWVNIQPASGPGMYYGGMSQSDGTFGIGTVPDGTWSLNVNVPWGSVYSNFAAKTIVVSGGTVTTVDGSANTSNSLMNALRLSDPAVNGLKGTVKGPIGSADENNGLANISLGIRTSGSMTGSQWTTTNSSGEFAVGGLAEGTYEIEAMPSWGSSYSRTKATHIITSSASTRSGLVIRLTQPNVTATIKTPLASEDSSSSTNPTPDTAVAWAWVSIYREGPMMTGGGWYGANTDQNGAFTLGGIDSGTYTVEVNPNWGSAYSKKKVQGITFTSSGDCTQSTDTDGNGATTDGDSNTSACSLNNLIGTGSTKAVRLSAPQLKGSIVDPSSNGLANSWIMVRSTDWSSNAGANTDSSG
ncbi:carboxypeptidase regulatory-like domain-containing protein, partial [Candidatus Uhrbacteria bacterium]|nr:carboxypeptidase regulatory-like domain-containing protein [Candidatus Uhrbacteria bacterium]